MCSYLFLILKKEENNAFNVLFGWQLRESNWVTTCVFFKAMFRIFWAAITHASMYGFINYEGKYSINNLWLFIFNSIEARKLNNVILGWQLRETN